MVHSSKTKKTQYKYETLPSFGPSARLGTGGAPWMHPPRGAGRCGPKYTPPGRPETGKEGAHPHPHAAHDMTRHSARNNVTSINIEHARDIDIDMTLAREEHNGIKRRTRARHLVKASREQMKSKARHARRHRHVTHEADEDQERARARARSGWEAKRERTAPEIESGLPEVAPARELLRGGGSGRNGG